MGLLIYLDDLKGSSVVARESANSFKDKLERAAKAAVGDDVGRLRQMQDAGFQPKELANRLPDKISEPQVLTLQGWHKAPLLIMRPLERIIYCVEQPDKQLQEMMDHHAEVKKQRQDMMKEQKLIRPS